MRDRIVVARKRAALVGGDEPAEHPARVVLAVVGLVREQDDDAEVVARRVAQLGLEDRDDLG